MEKNSTYTLHELTELRVRTKSFYTVFPWISARVPLKNFGFKEEHVLERGRLSEGSAY